MVTAADATGIAEGPSQTAIFLTGEVLGCGVGMGGHGEGRHLLCPQCLAPGASRLIMASPPEVEEMDILAKDTSQFNKTFTRRPSVPLCAPLRLSVPL